MTTKATAQMGGLTREDVASMKATGCDSRWSRKQKDALCDLALQAIDRWVPVSERLPERAGWYGVIDADGEKRAARWHSDGFWMHQVVEPIKYWCEFPPPPERP